MKKLLLLLCLTLPGFCYATEASVVMAEILAELNHFPSEIDNEFLDEILAGDEATKNEKVLAAALKRVQHKAMSEDVGALVDIERKTGTYQEKTIAAAILSINHQVSEMSLKQLETLMN